MLKFEVAFNKEKKKIMTFSSYPKRTLRGEILKKKILIAIGDLPLIPRIVLNTQLLLVNPNSNIEEIGKLLEADPEIAAGVLKVANSSYYGLRTRITSVQRAIVMLGFKIIGEIITAVAISKFLSKTLKGYRLGSEYFWQHSMAVAFGSKIIAEKRRPRSANDAFWVGLFHDVGKIVLDKYILERKEAFDEILDNGQHSFLSAEEKILGFDHADMIYELFKKWKFPRHLAVAIKHHHSPFFSKGGELSNIIYVANLIAKMKQNSVPQQIDKRALELLGLQEKEISIIMVEVVETVAKIKKEIFGNYSKSSQK
jgi:HD-like signal output (HDOD) protein